MGHPSLRRLRAPIHRLGALAGALLALSGGLLLLLSELPWFPPSNLLTRLPVHPFVLVVFGMAVFALFAGVRLQGDPRRGWGPAMTWLGGLVLVVGGILLGMPTLLLPLSPILGGGFVLLVLGLAVAVRGLRPARASREASRAGPALALVGAALTAGLVVSFEARWVAALGGLSPSFPWEAVLFSVAHLAPGIFVLGLALVFRGLRYPAIGGSPRWRRSAVAEGLGWTAGSLGAAASLLVLGNRLPSVGALLSLGTELTQLGFGLAQLVLPSAALGFALILEDLRGALHGLDSSEAARTQTSQPT